MTRARMAVHVLLWESVPALWAEGHCDEGSARAEQIVGKLREGDGLLNEGQGLTRVLRQLEVSESRWNRWRARQ